MHTCLTPLFAFAFTRRNAPAKSAFEQPPREERRQFLCTIKLVIAFSAAVLLLAGCGPRETAKSVQVVADWENLEPFSSIEVRFDEAIATAEEVGVAGAKCPLRFSPPLRGEFTWRSQRSGSFTFSEPLAMDTRYEVSLAPDLRDAEGQIPNARLRKRFRTPSFSLAAFLPASANTEARSEPEIKLFFNEAVNAPAMRRFMAFRDGRGRQITAEVRQGTEGEQPEPYDLSPSRLQTWEQQSVRNPEAGVPGNEPSEKAGTNVIPNFLIVSPKQPLPVGNGWRLVLSGGLPSAKNGYRLSKACEVAIGNVTPFTLVESFATHTIHKDASINLTFTKVPPNSLLTNWGSYITVSPVPSKLDGQISGRTLSLVGSYESGNSYALLIRSNLPAQEPFVLGTNISLQVIVPPVPPRLYFSEFSCEQLASGNRLLRLLAVNVPRIQVKAKLMEPHDAVRALSGFSHYYRDYNERSSWNEPYRRLHYPLVPGRTVYEAQQPGATAQDVPADIDLGWDKLLGGRKTGVVFVEVERAKTNDEYTDQPRLGTQTLVQLTDLGILWKSTLPARDGTPEDSRANVLSAAIQAFVFSYSSGKAVPGAAVTVLDGEGKVISQSTTGPEGIVTVQTGGPDGAGRWLCAEHEGDFHAVDFENFNIPVRGHNMEHVAGWWNEQETERRRVLLFSDREVYRPGETMQLKAIVRDWQDEQIAVPDRITGTLTLDDMNQTRVWETNVQFSAMGSWAGSIPLTLETRGSYRVELKVEGKTYGHSFLVKDYESAAFEIQMPSKPAYAPDEKIELPVKANYYFGQPLSKPKVKWWLHAEGTKLAADLFKSFDFGRCDLEGRIGRGRRSTLTLSGELQPAEATNLVIRPEMPPGPGALEPRSAFVMLEITDVNNQTLSHQVNFVQHSSEFYLGIKAPEVVSSPGEPVIVRLVAAARDGSPWQQPVAAKIVLKRVNWNPVRVQGAGRSVRFRTEAVLTNVLEKVIELPPGRVPEREGDEIAATLIEWTAPLTAGEYLLEASATDPAGRPVLSSAGFTVSAADKLGWDYKDEAQLVLKPNHAVYAPGETAQILVEAPFSGLACITVEREKILRTFTMKLEGNAPVLPVRIEKGDAPNVFVSVTLVRGMADCPRDIKEPECRVGYAELSVKDPERVLDVAVNTDAPSYLPGQSVKLEVLVKDGAGAPLQDAEVTLYAVDEGVVSLTAAAVPDPFGFFYQPRYLRVRAGTSLPFLMSEDPEALTFGNKGYLGGGGGKEMAVRNNFMACAFWYSSLVTDANGKVSVTSPAPDSLTRYRIAAVAHTRSSQFGSGKGVFEVAKPLIVEPALPRFANVTDKVLARAVVHNLTKTPGEVAVSLQLDRHARSHESSTELAQIVEVAAQSSATVEFPLEFTEQGQAEWIWTARFANTNVGTFEDAVRSSLLVNYPAPMLRQVVHRAVSEPEANLLEGLKPDLLSGSGTLTVQLANTRLAGLGEAVTHLLQYPYGCAEQTCSSLMPWIVLYNTPWKSLLSRDDKDPSKAIRSGIMRLFAMQRPSGGLSYWPGLEEPMPWVSAYAGVVLGLAKRSGIAVPNRDFDHLLSYLSEHLRSTNGPSPDVACLSTYALALGGRAEPAYHEKLFAGRTKLDSESRCLLALAVAESGGSADMALALLESAPLKSGALSETFGSDSRSAAIELLAWVCSRPEDAKIGNLVAALMAGQKAGNWATTQGNAWALLALTEYARRVEKDGTHACDGELVCGDQAVPFGFGAEPGIKKQVFQVNASAKTPGLRLSNGRGTVFTSVTAAMRPTVLVQRKQEHGFKVERAYQRLNDQNEPEEAKSLRVGDRVLVSLRVEAKSGGRFVAIDDPLPSNIEALDSVFKTQQTFGVNTAETRDASRGSMLQIDFREIRADRILFFANHVRPGVYWLRYVGRVRAAADAIAPPAKIEEMYRPDRFALSGSVVISSTTVK